MASWTQHPRTADLRFVLRHPRPFRRRRASRDARRVYLAARAESNRLIRDQLGWPHPEGTP